MRCRFTPVGSDRSSEAAASIIQNLGADHFSLRLKLALVRALNSDSSNTAETAMKTLIRLKPQESGVMNALMEIQWKSAEVAQRAFEVIQASMHVTPLNPCPFGKLAY